MASSYDIRQIAQAMGRQKRVAERRAQKECWKFTEVTGRGGRRRIYQLDDLPPKVQTALLLAFVAPESVPTRQPRRSASAHTEAQLQSAWTRYESVSQRQKGDAAHRLKALHAVERLVAAGTALVEARELVATQLQRENVRGASPVALWRWSKLVEGAPRDAWLALLVSGYAGRTVTAEIEPDAWDLFKADYLRLEAPAAAACYERLGRIARTRGWELPSLRTFERRLDREIPPAVRVFRREGEEALGRMYPAQERDVTMFAAMEAVNADGHKFDVFVKWHDGTIGRPLMVAFQDLGRRKLLAYRVGQTESSDLVRLAWGDMVTNYGIPKHVWLDNGRGFASKWLTGGTPTRYRFKVRAEDPVGIITGMGVDVHWTTPYHGQAKPIERTFRDLCEYVAKHPAFAGAYTGNNPTAKPENYASRAVPIDEFMRVLADEMKAHNARPGRRSKACAGLSFDEAFNASYATATVRKATVEQRRLWLLAAEGVTASRADGSVALLGNRYWTEALSRFKSMKVVVRFDPDHLHGSVHAYTLAGAYIGEAECIAPAGFADTSAGREHNRARNQYKRAAKDMAKAEVRMDAAKVADQMPGGKEPELPDPAVISGTFTQRRAPAANAAADDAPSALDIAMFDRVRRMKAQAL